MSYTSQTKGDRNKAKFQASNINNVFKGKSTETQQKPTHRQYGMQVLGRVSHVRRMPRPSVLPSLKAETGGNDPRVNLVPPGGQGWGGSTDSGTVMRNSRAEALLDSPPHQQTVSTAGGPSVQGGRTVGAQPVAVSSGSENRSWSRVTVGNAAGGGVSVAGGGGGSGSVNTVSGNSGGGHNGWAPASGGAQGLSTASQRDFPKLGSNSAVQNVTSGDTSLRPQGSLSGNWRDRGRTGVPTSSGCSQPPAPLSPTNVPESVDVSGGGVGIASQSGLASSGNRANVQALVSSNTRAPSHHPSFTSSTVGGSTRTFADTGNATRFDGSSTGTTGGTGNRTGGKVLQQSRTSVPLRTTLDDKAASTAPTGWAADQGELDFSERIVFSDEEEESPLPSKPKQMVNDEKVLGTSTNGDLPSHNARQHIPMSQASDFPGSNEATVAQLSHGMPGHDVKNVSQRVTGPPVGHSSIVNRKPDDADNVMNLNTRPVVGLMQITPGSTTHQMPMSHPHPTQQHNFASMSGVREAWAAGPTTSPAVLHHQQHQPSQFSMVLNQGRIAQGPGFGAPTPAASMLPSHHFPSNPSHMMAPPVSAGGPVYAPSQEDKHLSDQRTLHQKEYKMCIERARMKKRTDEGEVRGSASCAIEEDRDAQRSRPRQRFDAPSGSSKGSISDVAGLSDECEPARSLPTAPREETGPPGGPPMPPPVPIVQPPPQPPTAAGHSTYPVPPHGLPPGPFNAIPAAAAAAHYAPRAPWPGHHPPGATAATYPHPPQPHPSFQHQYAPPQAQIPTHLLDPNIRPKTTQEYTVLIEKFHEFLLQESKKDKNGKPDTDQRPVHPTGRSVNDPNQKSVVEQKDPFAEEEPHEIRESSMKGPIADASGASGLNQQPKHGKRESHQESPNLVSGPTPGMKRPIAQTQMPRDENSQEPNQGSRRGGDFRPNSSERDTQSRGGTSRSDVWEDRSNWNRRKSEDNEEIGDYGEEEGADAEDNKKRLGSRDVRVHGGTQKRNRNMGDQYYSDYHGRKTKNTAFRTSQRGGVTKPTKTRGGSTSGGAFPASHNFDSEEELQRPPRGGSAGQLSRSSSSLAERNEWHSDDMSANDQHRQSHQHPQSQLHKRGSGASRRGSRGSNVNASGNRSRDYGPQTYNTWAGSSSGMRSYNNYHRTNPSSYGTGPMRGARHRYAIDPYSQQQYYDDYSYDYNYSMDEFGGQWHPAQTSERPKQNQQSRRDGKKNIRDRTTQNRSSAPPAGSNERSESSQQSQQQQQSSQQTQQQSQQATDTVPGKQSRRDQHSRSRDVGAGGRNVANSGKTRPVSKKQGSTESNTSSNTESNSANKALIISDHPKPDEEKTKETEEKPVVQLQPAPAPAVNVWNTKHPLIANPPAGSVPASQSSEGMVVTDLMTGTITMNNEPRSQVTSSSEKIAPKPLMVPSESSQGASEEKESNVEARSLSAAANTGAGSEPRRGRESSKSRRERPTGRQGRGEKRGGSGRRGGGGGACGGGSGTQNSGGTLSHRDGSDVKSQQDSQSQSNTQDDAFQRNRRRNRQNKENTVDTVENQMGYLEEDYVDYDYDMQHNYLSGRHPVRHSGRARGYRGYHYRAFSGGARSYFQNYYGSGSRSYYPASSRYYVTQPRYRSGGSRSGTFVGASDGDGHTGTNVSGTGKRQGSVSKETVTSDGNEQEDWETASESSDVANRDSRRRPPSGGSGGGGAAGGGSGGSTTTPGGSGSSSYGGSVSHQQQQQQPQQRQRGRQQKSCAMTPVSQTSEDKGCDGGSGSSTPQQSHQRKRNRMEGIDLNNFASVVAVDNLPEVTVDEEFLYDNAAEFVEVLSKSARKTKKREELKQKQEQEQLVQREPRSRQMGGRRGTTAADGSKRRTVSGSGTVGTGSSGSSPPKRLQSSKMTADERRRQKKAASTLVKPGSMVTPLLSTIPVTEKTTSGNVATTASATTYPVNTVTNTSTGRPNKTKLPPRLAKQQQQQQQHQQQHIGNTTAPPLMSLDSAELEQSVMAADLSAGRKGHAVASASVTDFKIESWDNRLAEDIPKMRRNAEQQMLSKTKGQANNSDTSKSSVLAPIAPPGNTNSVTSAKADSGVDTGGDVSDRSSHSSGNAATNDNRSQTPSQTTTSESTVTGQAINSALLEASVVHSSLQTSDVVVDSSNEEYKLPDGFVLSCHRVTGDFDEIKPAGSNGPESSTSSNATRSSNTKVSEISVPVRERTDSSKTADVTRTLNDVVVSASTASSSGTSSDQLLPSASVSLPSSSVHSAVEEGTSSLNKKIALVKSCWAEANLPTTSTSESETLLSTVAVSASAPVGDAETNVSSAVVISNVCKVKPQQKLSAPVSTSSPSVVADEQGSVASATSNATDASESHSVFPGASHLSTLASSAPSFIPKAALIQPTNQTDSILNPSGAAGVMFAQTGGFQHLGSAPQRSAYGPPVGNTGFNAQSQPTPIGRSTNLYTNNATAKCPPVSLSIPMAQTNVAAKALSMGLGFGINGNGGNESTLLGHAASGSNNAAMAALIQRQNSNSVGVIAPPTGPSTPQCSGYQSFTLQNNMSSAAAGVPTPPTPTGGSWSSQYGPHLNFPPGLPSAAPAGAQQAWTFLKNQTPSAGSVQPGPGLASPNTPSPGPRQPFIFNLWPLGPGAQAQQSASGGQQTGLSAAANPANALFGAPPAPPPNKYPVTSNTSQLGAMPPAPPNIHNLVGLQQFRSGILDNNTNCSVQSSMFDTSVFPPQAPQQQQQPSFPFPDFTSFSQPTQMPLKPQVGHNNTPGSVQGVPSQPHQHQPVDNIFALFANEFGSNRGNECKTPNLNPLCVAPYSQPTPQPQAPSTRFGISGLSSNLTVPTAGILNKHNALDLTSTAGMNSKPQTGWGTSGMMPVSSSSHGTNIANHNPHFQRSSIGPITPARSSPTIMGITSNSGPLSAQSLNNRRVMSGSPSLSQGQVPSQQTGYATQQYSSGPGYRSYGGNNSGSSRGSGGFSGSRPTSRGGVRGSGHSSRGGVFGGAHHRNNYRTTGGGNNSRMNQSRNNYNSRNASSGATNSESISRRLPAENIQSDEDGENRTVNQSLVSTSFTISTNSTTVASSPASTSTSCTTTTTNSTASVSASSSCSTAVTPSNTEANEESTAKFDPSVTASVCDDISREPSNAGTVDGSRDIESDGPTDIALSPSSSPSHVSKNGQVENATVLRVDGASDKLESVSLTSAVMQNPDSSQVSLSVATVKY